MSTTRSALEVTSRDFIDRLIWGDAADEATPATTYMSVPQLNTADTTAAKLQPFRAANPVFCVEDDNSGDERIVRPFALIKAQGIALPACMEYTVLADGTVRVLQIDATTGSFEAVEIASRGGRRRVKRRNLDRKRVRVRDPPPSTPAHRAPAREQLKRKRSGGGGGRAPAGPKRKRTATRRERATKSAKAADRRARKKRAAKKTTRKRK